MLLAVRPLGRTALYDSMWAVFFIALAIDVARLRSQDVALVIPSRYRGCRRCSVYMVGVHRWITGERASSESRSQEQACSPLPPSTPTLCR